MVFGLLHQPDARTQELVQVLQRREVQISESALCQRFSPQAVTLLDRLRQEVISEGFHAQAPAPVEVLQRFEAVIVEDSSTIKLPDKLKDLWPG